MNAPHVHGAMEMETKVQAVPGMRTTRILQGFRHTR